MSNEQETAENRIPSPSDDPTTLREALAHYRAWNEADFVHRVLSAGTKTQSEKWEEYRAMFAFARATKPELSPLSQIMANQEWVDYYEQLERFEAQRQLHGR